ncbi:hypothetical protein [Natronomonas sp. EA1]|uniref:hypothetical protein n=1 Tax=Natronomonas sp. EA1 TaxID=3421655 RepID=UPI003EC08C47
MTAIWRAFLGSSAVLLVLLGLSTPFIRPGTGSYTVSLLSFGMLSVMFLGSALFIALDWDPLEELA